MTNEQSASILRPTRAGVERILEPTCFWAGRVAPRVARAGIWNVCQTTACSSNGVTVTGLTTAPPLTTSSAPLPIASTLAIGLAGGCALGIVARAWMRLISEDPEFSWSGTLFIVVGFTIFGLGQSIVAASRKRVRARWKLTGVRVIGVVTMLPLFVAAGMVMFPTVIGGGLAMARTQWRGITRIACLVVAAVPVLLVGSELVDAFGWSLRALAGFVQMLGIYAAIVWATRFTMAAQLDGWRMPRRAKVASALGFAAFASLLVVSSVGFG